MVQSSNLRPTPSSLTLLAREESSFKGSPNSFISSILYQRSEKGQDLFLDSVVKYFIVAKDKSIGKIKEDINYRLWEVIDTIRYLLDYLS
jgi:hypothetical protein